MASHGESGEPGASISLSGPAGPISPMAPIRSLGSATDAQSLAERRAHLASISLPVNDGVLSRCLATRAVQRPLPCDGRRLCSAARPPSPTLISCAPAQATRPRTPVACVGVGDALACLLAMCLPTHPRRHTRYTDLAGSSVSALAGWEGGVACCGMLPSIMTLGETLTARYLSPHGNPQRGLPNRPEWVLVEAVAVPPATSHSYLLRFRLRACCALAVSMQRLRG